MARKFIKEDEEKKDKVREMETEKKPLYIKLAIVLILGIILGSALGSLVTVSFFKPQQLASTTNETKLEGYSEKILEILKNSTGPSLTPEQIAQIQYYLNLASHHEIPPWMWHSPPQTWIEPGSEVETASYIIFGDGQGNYYAKSGWNGSIMFSGRDAATVIQYAVNNLPTYPLSDFGRKFLAGKIFLKGELVIKSPLNFTNLSGLVIEGEGGRSYSPTRVIIETSASVVFDLTNSRYFFFRNIHFEVASGYTPSVVFLLARNTNNYSVGEGVFKECTFNDIGGVTTAFVYDYGAELMVFDKCEWYAKGRSVYITSSNKAGVSSPFTTISSGSISTSMISFPDNFFYGDNAPQELIRIEGAVQVNFDKCFFGGNPSVYAFLIDSSTSTTQGLKVENSHFEKLGFTAIGPSSGWSDIIGMVFEGNTINVGSGTQTFFDFNRTQLVLNRFSMKNNINLLSTQTVVLSAYIIDNSEIDCRGELYPFKITTSQYGRYSRFVVQNSGYLVLTGGSVAVDIVYYTLVQKNSGTAVFSGDGTTTQFAIAHGLSSTPTTAIVTPASSGASGSFYVTVDATYIYVNYATAPPAGTNNVVLYWEAKM
jgi:hypothetical protein